MIKNLQLASLWAKALAQYVEAPPGLSPQDFFVLRQSFSLPNIEEEKEHD